MISIPDINQEELLNDCIDGIQVKDSKQFPHQQTSFGTKSNLC